MLPLKQQHASLHQQQTRGYAGMPQKPQALMGMLTAQHMVMPGMVEMPCVETIVNATTV